MSIEFAEIELAPAALWYTLLRSRTIIIVSCTRTESGKTEFVSSVKEWLNLAKLDIPVVKDENDTGRVYRVLKVGMFLADPGDCEKHDVAAVPNPTGKCTLPTCVIEESGHGRRLCQLPLDLAGWAEHVVGAAHPGAKLFPCDVELGLLRDRIYAEML